MIPSSSLIFLFFLFPLIISFSPLSSALSCDRRSLIEHSIEVLSDPIHSQPLYPILSSSSFRSLISSPRCFHLLLFLTSTASPCPICIEVESNLYSVATAFHRMRFSNQTESIQSYYSNPKSPLLSNHFIYFISLDAGIPENLEIFRMAKVTQIPKLLFISATEILPPPTIILNREDSEFDFNHPNSIPLSGPERRLFLRRQRYHRLNNRKQQMKNNNSTTNEQTLNGKNRLIEAESVSEELDSADEMDYSAPSNITFADSEYILSPHSVPAYRISHWLAKLTNSTSPLNKKNQNQFIKPKSTSINTKSNNNNNNNNEEYSFIESFLSGLIRLFGFIIFIGFILLFTIFISNQFFFIPLNYEIIYHRMTYFILSMLIYLFCITGGWFNYIRSAPFIHASQQHGFMWFHPAPRDQFVVESMILAVFYSIVSGLFIFLSIAILKSGPTIATPSDRDTNSRDRKTLEAELERLNAIEREIDEERNNRRSLTKPKELDLLKTQIAIRRGKNTQMLELMEKLEFAAAETGASEEEIRLLRVEQPYAVSSEWLGIHPATLAVAVVIFIHVLFAFLRAINTKKMPNYNYGWGDVWV